MSDLPVGWPSGPASTPRPAAMSFAPEAHLPRERRLLVNSTGLTLETGLGVRHLIPWHECALIMAWPDRVELVLNTEVSVVIRARDWHHGSKAITAIRQHAPAGSISVMPDDPEPVADGYVLRGLATSSSAVLAVLALSLLLVAAIGLGVGLQDKRAIAVVIGLAFGLASGGTVRALYQRLQVPSRWRDRAAVRGRASVALDAGIAASSDRRLHVLEWLLYGAALVAVGLLVSGALHVWPAPILPVVVAARMRFERQRRERRRRPSS